jgi:hypothetical protein
MRFLRTLHLKESLSVAAATYGAPEGGGEWWNIVRSP